MAAAASPKLGITHIVVWCVFMFVLVDEICHEVLVFVLLVTFFESPRISIPVSGIELVDYFSSHKFLRPARFSPYSGNWHN